MYAYINLEISLYAAESTYAYGLTTHYKWRFLFKSKCLHSTNFLVTSAEFHAPMPKGSWRRDAMPINHLVMHG